MASYRTVEFNRMVMQRPMWMRHLLSRGYSVRYGEMWGDVGSYVAETPPLAGLLGAAARGTSLTDTATSLDQALVVSATQAPPDASSPWP